MRKLDGVHPVIRLNVLLKFVLLLNPHSVAISVRFFWVDLIKSMAYSTLLFEIYSDNVIPLYLLKTDEKYAGLIQAIFAIFFKFSSF